MQVMFGVVLDGATTTGPGPTRGPNSQGGVQTAQFTHLVATNGSLSSTIRLEGSNWPNSSLLTGQWVNLGQVDLVGSTALSGSLQLEAPMKWYRGNVISGSGTSSQFYIHISQSL